MFVCAQIRFRYSGNVSRQSLEQEVEFVLIKNKVPTRSARLLRHESHVLSSSLTPRCHSRASRTWAENIRALLKVARPDLGGCPASDSPCAEIIYENVVLERP